MAPEGNKVCARFILSLMLPFLGAGLLLILTHAMWQDEWQAWLLARDSASLAELFRHLRYEGHPGLWHLCLYAISRVTHQAAAMQLFHLLLAAVAAWLFLQFSPFSRWHKGLCIFGYFPFFEYAVISRNYVLGVLLIFLFCALYRAARPKNYPVLGAMLFLLCQTSIYGLMIALALMALVVLEGIQPQKSEGGLPQNGQALIALIPGLLGVAVALLQLLPPADAGFAVGWKWDLDSGHILRTLAALWQGYVPIPALEPHFWGTNILANQSLQALGALGLGFLGVCLLLRSPPVLCLYLLGTLGLLTFAYTKYPGSLRHHGHLYILLIACLWLAAPGPEKEPRTAMWRRLADFGRRHRDKLLTGLLGAHLLAAAVALSFVCRYPFSESYAAAQFIQENQLTRLCLMGDTDDAASAVGGYLHRRLYYPASGRSGSFIIWDQRRQNLKPAEVLRQAGELARQRGEEVLLILNYPLEAPEYPVTLVRQFDRSIVPVEDFYLYRMARE